MREYGSVVYVKSVNAKRKITGKFESLSVDLMVNNPAIIGLGMNLSLQTTLSA